MERGRERRRQGSPTSLVVAQAGALAFVIGSYYAAEWFRKRHVRRALAADRAATKVALSNPEAADVVGQSGAPDAPAAAPLPLVLSRRE